MRRASLCGDDDDHTEHVAFGRVRKLSSSKAIEVDGITHNEMGSDPKSIRGHSTDLAMLRIALSLRMRERADGTYVCVKMSVCSDPQETSATTLVAIARIKVGTATDLMTVRLLPWGCPPSAWTPLPIPSWPRLPRPHE